MSLGWLLVTAVMTTKLEGLPVDASSCLGWNRQSSDAVEQNRGVVLIGILGFLAIRENIIASKSIMDTGKTCCVQLTTGVRSDVLQITLLDVM